MPLLLARRSRGLLVSVALLGLLAACMQPQPAPAPAPPPAAAAPPPAAAAPAGPTVTAMTNVHVRSGPSMKAKVIGTLKKGTSVQSDGQRQGKWVHVMSGGQSGWVAARYVH